MTKHILPSACELGEQGPSPSYLHLCPALTYQIRKKIGTGGREADSSENERLRIETAETENTAEEWFKGGLEAFIIAGTAFLGADGPENVAARTPTSMFPTL